MESLTKELPFLDLPSSMWGVHIHPRVEFIAILHINISNSKINIDKGLVLTQEKCSVAAKIFLNGFIAHVPDIILDVNNLSELSALVHLLHSKSVCKNVGEPDGSPDCLQMMDELESSPLYCNMCQEKHILLELTQSITDTHKYEEPDDVNISNIQETVEQCQQIESKVMNNAKDTKDDLLKQSKQMQALCNFCGKRFPSGYRIEEHILIHTQVKPFRCKICHKTFSKKFNLKMHEHTHSGARPYICNICGKSYTTSSNLRTHTQSSHNNEKKYVCSICKMTFVYPRYLKLHMRKHTGEKPFICTICGKNFSKNIHLTIHKRTHTGEKPHCCDICGKSFTTTGGLGYHKRVHIKNHNL